MEQITAQDAGKIAKKYYEEIASGEKHRLILEEVELSNDGKYWLITLGIYTPTTAMMLRSQGIDEAANYKIFKINKSSGEVISMKMRSYPLASVSLSASPSLSPGK